jgi:drug/metabolite transporter (DMT)-like permease
MEEYRRSRSGILMGAGAILLWSSSASLAVVGSTLIGQWQFLAMAGAIGGLLQVCFYRRFCGTSLGRLLFPPLRVWLLILLGFVFYQALWLNALAMAEPGQLAGVSLTNYFWPTLTVVLAVLLVPGTKATWRLGAALTCSLAGLGVANFNQITSQLGLVGGGDHTAHLAGPYIMAGAAAVAWALYSALVARWRSWVCDYATSPVGFLIAAAMAALICTAKGQWAPLNATSWLVTVFAAVGPFAGGYLLWELSLHRAPAGTLGLLAAATPILATLCLCVLFVVWPVKAPPASSYPLFLAGAGLIALSVGVGAYRSKKETTEVRNEAKLP